MNRSNLHLSLPQPFISSSFSSSSSICRGSCPQCIPPSPLFKSQISDRRSHSTGSCPNARTKKEGALPVSVNSRSLSPIKNQNSKFKNDLNPVLCLIVACRNVLDRR